MISILKAYIIKSGELMMKEPELSAQIMIERQQGLLRKLLEIMPENYRGVKSMIEEAVTPINNI